jgi:thymidine kinase
VKTSAADIVAEVDREVKRVERTLLEHVVDHGKLGIVQAPPGSGKTTLLLKAVEFAAKRKMRIAVAAQTNSQADDICRRMARDYPRIPAIRFAASGSEPQSLGVSVTWETQSGRLPHGTCVVIGTAAKWGLVNIHEPFDAVFVDEAWQLSWSDFMLLGQVAECFALIGDPGQIPPVARTW